MAKCQHCSTPNPEGMFNCPSCGKRAHPPMATAIRKDQIDFGCKSMGDHIKQVQKKNAKAREKKMNSLVKWD